MKRVHAVLACVPLFLVLAGCGEQSKPAATQPKEPEKPAEAVGSQKAFDQMYILARAWAPDAKILTIADIPHPKVKSEKGKAGAWECTFVSEKKMRTRRFVYSVSAVPEANLAKGAVGSPEEQWVPGGKARPLALMYFKIDSPAAYEVAMKKGADYVKKNPDMEMHYVMEWAKQLTGPNWRVIWGESLSKSDYSIYVNAQTGEFTKIQR